MRRWIVRFDGTVGATAEVEVEAETEEEATEKAWEVEHRGHLDWQRSGYDPSDADIYEVDLVDDEPEEPMFRSRRHGDDR